MSKQHASFDDFEDATQFYSALQSEVDIIITRNTKDFKESSIKVMTPNDFITMLKLAL